MRENLQVKLYPILTTPMLIAGVPRQFAILNGTFCLAFVVGLHNLYVLPLFFIFHIAAVVFTKKDPYFFAVALRHLKQKLYYHV